MIKIDIVSEKEMLNVCIGSNNPRIVVNFFGKEEIHKSGYATERAYVSKGPLCKGPISNIDKLEEELFK